MEKKIRGPDFGPVDFWGAEQPVIRVKLRQSTAVFSFLEHRLKVASRRLTRHREASMPAVTGTLACSRQD